MSRPSKWLSDPQISFRISEALYEYDTKASTLKGVPQPAYKRAETLVHRLANRKTAFPPNIEERCQWSHDVHQAFNSGAHSHDHPTILQYKELHPLAENLLSAVKTRKDMSGLHRRHPQYESYGDAILKCIFAVNIAHIASDGLQPTFHFQSKEIDPALCQLLLEDTDETARINASRLAQAMFGFGSSYSRQPSPEDFLRTVGEKKIPLRQASYSSLNALIKLRPLFEKVTSPELTETYYQSQRLNYDGLVASENAFELPVEKGIYCCAGRGLLGEWCSITRDYVSEGLAHASKTGMNVTIYTSGDLAKITAGLRAGGLPEFCFPVINEKELFGRHLELVIDNRSLPNLGIAASHQAHSLSKTVIHQAIGETPEPSFVETYRAEEPAHKARGGR